MTLNNASMNLMPSPASQNAAQKINRLQAELISTARMWAVDEVGAAMAHQINEPLTALLLYLHEIKSGSGQTTSTGPLPESILDIVDKALRETERVVEIMERIGQHRETPPDAENGTARGREALDWLSRHENGRGQHHAPSSSANVRLDILTPREREVLALITDGVSNKEGGYRLGISMRTFEVHRAHIMGKLGAKNAADLVRMALSQQR